MIVAVDGTQVRSPNDVSQAMSGEAHRLTGPLHRAARQCATDGRAEDGRRPRPGRDRGIIGVFLEQAADIHLPLQRLDRRSGVGGPSAGLAFALDVLEKLGRNVDGGRKIAATGELFLNGAVGPIGAVKQKTIGARRAGVDAFLVPAGDNAREARKYAEGCGSSL